MQCLVLSALSSQRCLHNAVYSMLSFLQFETVNKTCYVYIGAIITSYPFWLMVIKGLLFYALSRFMPCLVLLWYVPVACCYLALTLLPGVNSWHVSIFTKYVMLISFALFPFLFEPVLVWFCHSSAFIFCQESWVDHCHVLCCYVGVQ